MASKEIPVAYALSADGTGSAYNQRLDLLATTSTSVRMATVFPAGLSTKDTASLVFIVPEDYDTGTNPTLKIRWAANSTSTSQVVVWDVDVVFVAVGETINQALDTEQDEVGDSPAATAWFEQEATVTWTGSNLAVGDRAEVNISRDQTDATTTDDLGADAVVLSVTFAYDDGA